MRFIIAILGLVTAVLLYLCNADSKKKKKEELERLTAFLNEQIREIRTAVLSFFTDENRYRGYFPNHALQQWKIKYSYLVAALKNTSLEKLNIEQSYFDELRLFLNYYHNGDSIRDKYNKEFLEHELKSYCNFFDNIENRKLDLQQRTAVITDEDNNLIIAGAGSGKTTTIIGKVAYIIDRYKVAPQEILLISFTTKSAGTLAHRIGIDGIEAKTFHKFGKDVITAVEEKVPSVFDEQQFTQVIKTFFKDLIRDPVYLANVTTYFTNLLKIEKPQNEFENQGAYIQYMKDEDFRTYKTVAAPNNITFKREVVKSIEECKIANFLLFNSIDYKYEYPYPHETANQTQRQYIPDFTLRQEERTVYLEHFALNKNGRVPDFFAKKEKGQTVEEANKEYLDGIKWKQEIHNKFGTTLIETYSHEMFDDVLFHKLTAKLKEAGINITPKNPDEIWKIISDSAADEINNFIKLLQTFIILMKSNNYSLEELVNKNKGQSGRFNRDRNFAFLEIITPVYKKYEAYLAERKEIDFSDMINAAAAYIASGAYKNKFSYIIIDEFQDISIGRYRLIKALKEVNPSCKLFCVGDDWQSIYRFAGSDIALFKDFEKYFGYTATSKIETTYRFNDPLISLSTSFILKNANQTKKDLRAFSENKSTEYKIAYSYSENDNITATIKKIFDELIANGKAKGKEILLLGRYGIDFKKIRNDQNTFIINKAECRINYQLKRTDGNIDKLSGQFMTIHKSKGLEADIVIVVNCNSGKLGFPSGISDDSVLNLLLSDADQFENGEERRLFYVAMTRAKELVYFVADSSYKSKFIRELEVETNYYGSKKCPRCITADLILKKGIRNGKEWAFYGCTNFMYGCSHQEWVR